MIKYIISDNFLSLLTIIQSYWHEDLLAQVTGCSRSRSSKVMVTARPWGAVITQVHECLWAKLLG